MPAFRLLVDGQELAKEKNDVMSATYTDSLDAIDSFDLSVNNWDAEKRTFKYSDTDLFNPWKDAELWMGYIREGRDELRRMLTGEITTLAPNFPASGASTLTVGGLNMLHRFRISQQTRQFEHMRDTQVAQILINEIRDEVNKRSPRVRVQLDAADVARNLKREQPIDWLVLNNQYPIVFLMERARRIGYELTIEESRGKERVVTVHYRPTSDVPQTVRKFEYGLTLVNFQPTLQTARQVAEVTVRGWNPKTKEKFEETATRADLAEFKVLKPDDVFVTEPNLAKKIEVFADKPIQTKAEAKDLAKKKLLQLAQDLVECKAKTVGMPELRSGTKVEIAGVGKRFNGIYLVTSTTHSIGDGGYTTDFSARMEEKTP